MDWIAPLVTLILLEVVLGLDNVIFISIIAAKLPVHQQKKARTVGLILALFLRLALLGIISLILKLEGNLFTVAAVDISGKDLILILGGLFLIYKSSSEIYHKMEGEEGDTSKNIKVTSFSSVIIQILVLDLVFSIDSIITAIGMVDEFSYDLSSKVKVISHPITVDKSVIDETISDLKKRFGKVSYPETSEIGDNLFGELTGTNDFKREYAFIDTSKVEKKEQKKFAGLKKEDTVEFDIEKAISDVSAISQLLGISEEEAKSAKGKYTLKVTNISRTEPAEINTELFDRVFGKDAVTTEEAFLSKVNDTISENYKRESEHFLDHNIEDYFIQNTNITLPSDFLKTWLKATSNGEITDAVLENEFNAYVRGLKWDLIKNKIAEDNKIEVTTEEVRAKAKEMILAQFGGQAFAEQLGDRMDAIADNYLKNENGQNFMKLFNQLRHERILKLIKEKISVQEKPVSVEEFKKIVAEHKH